MQWIAVKHDGVEISGVLEVSSETCMLFELNL